MVESMSTRRTSPNAGSAVSSSKSRRSRPEATHRRNRLYTASQEPNSAGRSRHGMPVRARYKRASRNARSGSSGFWPWGCRRAFSTAGPRAAQSASVIMYRMGSESLRVRKADATGLDPTTSSVNTAYSVQQAERSLGVV